MLMSSFSPLARVAICQNQVPLIVEQLSWDLVADSKGIEELSYQIASVVIRNIFKPSQWVCEKPDRMQGKTISKWKAEILFSSSDLLDKLAPAIERVFHQSILSDPFEHISKYGSVQSVFSAYPLVVEFNKRLVDCPEALFIISLKNKSLSVLIEGVDLLCGDFSEEVEAPLPHLSKRLWLLKEASLKVNKLRLVDKVDFT
jgi:hypothetical protein